MSDLFTTDDLSLSPNFSAVSETKDLEFSLSAHENYYENSIFLNTDTEAELLIVEGQSEIILDSLNTVSLFDGSEFSVSIEHGTHDLISINGSIEVVQKNGNSLLYVEDFLNTSGLIKIEMGSLTIVNADSSNLSGEPILENGQLFIGGSETNYFIETNDQANIEILFRNVSQSNSESLTLVGKASGAPAKIPLETHDFENGDIEIFSEDSIDIKGYLNDYKVSLEDIDTHFVDSLSFDAEVANIIDDIQQNILELEIESDDDQGVEMQNSEVTIEAIIKVSDYVDLEWQDAVEIISDV